MEQHRKNNGDCDKFIRSCATLERINVFGDWV